MPKAISDRAVKRRAQDEQALREAEEVLSRPRASKLKAQTVKVAGDRPKRAVWNTSTMTKRGQKRNPSPSQEPPAKKSRSTSQRRRKGEGHENVDDEDDDIYGGRYTLPRNGYDSDEQDQPYLQTHDLLPPSSQCKQVRNTRSSGAVDVDKNYGKVADDELEAEDVDEPEADADEVHGREDAEGHEEEEDDRDVNLDIEKPEILSRGRSPSPLDDLYADPPSQPHSPDAEYPPGSPTEESSNPTHVPTKSRSLSASQPQPVEGFHDDNGLGGTVPVSYTRGSSLPVIVSARELYEAHQEAERALVEKVRAELQAEQADRSRDSRSRQTKSITGSKALAAGQPTRAHTSPQGPGGQALPPRRNIQATPMPREARGAVGPSRSSISPSQVARAAPSKQVPPLTPSQVRRASTSATQMQWTQDRRVGAHRRQGKVSRRVLNPAVQCKQHKPGVVPRQSLARYWFQRPIAENEQDHSRQISPSPEPNPAPSKHWPAESNLVVNDRNLLRINKQSYHIRVICNAIQDEFTTHYVFAAEADPPQERPIRQRQLVLKAIGFIVENNPNDDIFRAIHDRAQDLSSTKYMQCLVEVGEERLRSLRTKVKDCASTLVMQEYKLDNVRNRRAEVDRLTALATYIYPDDVYNANVCQNDAEAPLPFDRSIFPQVLMQKFFVGSNSISTTHHTLFPTMTRDRRAIPNSMLAIVAAGVYCALRE
ncbi:hypothetical protein K474DRAFT_1680909, partial [Panus rudis PR-1116 ss-1]